MRSGRWSVVRTQNVSKHRRPVNRLACEPLEPRCLLTATATEYLALSSGANGTPTQVTVASDGNLWFTEPGTNQVGIFSPTSHTVSDQVFTTATNGNPTAITATSGAQAAVWFNLEQAGQIGTIAVGSTVAEVLSEGGTYHDSAGVTQLNGVIWATIPGTNQVLEYNPASGDVKNYSLAPADINVSGFSSQIVAGADGNLWFTEPGAIGVFSPTSDSVIGQITLPTTSGTQTPAAIAIGPDGNMWFTESTASASAVGVINTATMTFVKEFALPAGSQPDGITSGPDNNIWFTESGIATIGMIDVTSKTDPTQDTLGAAITIPALGSAGGVVSNPDPLGITAGPDGNIWFTDGSGAMGVVTLNDSPHFAVSSVALSSVTAGTSFGLTVTDEYSPTVPVPAFDGSVTATIYNSDDVSVGSQTVTAVDGVAQFSGFTLDTAGSGYTISVTTSAANPPALVSTTPFSVVPAAPAHVILTTPPPGYSRGR